MTNIEHGVDKVWAAMLEDPAPPLPTAREALVMARRAGRRARSLTVLGCGLAAVVVVASVTVGVGVVDSGHTTPAEPRLGGSQPVGAPPVQQAAPPLPAAPDLGGVDARAAQRGALLLAAVPAGLTGRLQQLSSDGPAATWQFGDTAQYASDVDVVITSGPADGLLQLEIRGGLTGLGDDVCAAAAANAVAAVLSVPVAELGPCDTLRVDGVQIRVSSAHDPDRGDVNTAIRLLDGGLLVVEAQQGIPAHGADGNLPPDAAIHPADGQHTILGGWPFLPAVPLTTDQLAAIAVNPGLLP